LLFTSSTKPCHRLTRIYGTDGALEVDLNSQLIRAEQVGRYPGAFAKIEAPWKHVRDSSRNLARNLRRFWKGELHYFEGMKEMFRQFYEAILEGGECPVSHAEMIRVTRFMDQIFAECRRGDDERRDGKRNRRQATSDTPREHSGRTSFEENLTGVSGSDGS